MSLSFLLVLASLPMVPKVPEKAYNPTSLLQPIHLTLLPASFFTSLPPSIARIYDISRSFERLAWAWAALTALGAIARIVQRIQNSRRGSNDVKPSGLKSRSILNTSPGMMVVQLHILAWRLATILPKDAALVGQWPRDIGTVIGLAGGLIASWGEMRRLLGLFGWGRDPMTGPSWTLSIIHVLLSVHRLLLSVRIVSAAATAGSAYLSSSTL